MGYAARQGSARSTRQILYRDEEEVYVEGKKEERGGCTKYGRQQGRQ